jgi:hypothetical protein
MKKALSLILAIILAIGTISLTGCGGTDGSGVEMVSSYMLDDDTVVVQFRNETNKTISHVDGKLNLFGGSSNSQSPLKTASFEWDGTCEKGKTFEVTVSVYNAPTGLADDVNRIGFYISSIS